MEPFDPGRRSQEAHALLVDAYKNGGGSVGSYESWRTALRDDPEYDPAVIFPSVNTQGRLIGFAQCWTSSFLKDLAVSEDWRRKGLGRALVLHAFAVFRARGAIRFDLKVEDNNPPGAERLYRQLGMRDAD